MTIMRLTSIRILPFTLAALLHVAAAVAATTVAPFDGRAWTVGNRQANGSQILTEYVLPGQTVKQWKELLTSTIFLDPDHRVPLSRFLARIQTSMAAGCPSLVWNVIRQDDKSVVFEWHDSGCGGFEAQSEIDRLAVGVQGVYRLAYAVKGRGPMAAEKRDVWLAIFDRMPLAETQSETPSPSAAPSPAPSTDPSARTVATRTRALAAVVSTNGMVCETGLKSEKLESQGGVAQWRIECSGNKNYTVLIDPSGAVTVVKSK